MKDKNTPEIGHGWFSITQAKEIGASIHIGAASNYPVTVSEVSPEKPTKYTDVVSVGKVFVNPVQVDPKYPKPVVGKWKHKNMKDLAETIRGYTNKNPYSYYDMVDQYLEYNYDNNMVIRRR